VHAPGDTAVFDLGPLLGKSLLNLNNFQQPEKQGGPTAARVTIEAST
jgi:hypothetical protein